MRKQKECHELHQEETPKRRGCCKSSERSESLWRCPCSPSSSRQALLKYQLSNGSSGEVRLHHAKALPSTLQLDRCPLHIPVPQSTDQRATETVCGEFLDNSFISDCNPSSQLLSLMMLMESSWRVCKAALMRLRSQEI